jgi:hypothetical protein
VRREGQETDRDDLVVVRGRAILAAAADQLKCNGLQWAARGSSGGSAHHRVRHYRLLLGGNLKFFNAANAANTASGKQLVSDQRVRKTI